MKRIFALCLIAFAVLAYMPAMAQDDITIGGISSYSSSVPTDCEFNNSIAQFIYTSDEIGGECYIGSIIFRHSDTPDLGGGAVEMDRSFNVYFTVTSQSDYENNGWVAVSPGDLVSTVGVTMPSNSADITIPLDNIFHYDGSGNLAITIVDNNSDYENNHYFWGDNGSVNRSAYRHNDVTTFSISSMPEQPSLSHFRPRITLHTVCMATLPYVEEFNNGLGCWTVVDLDGNGYCWEMNDIYSANRYPTSDSYPGDGWCDDWLFSPAIQLDENTNITLGWLDATSGGVNKSEDYKVYVSNVVTTEFSELTEVFSTRLSEPMFHWTLRTVDLTDFAGQTIYVAFRHKNLVRWQERLLIDSVFVYSEEEVTPIEISISIEGPSTARVGDTVYFNAVGPTDLDLSYSWLFLGASYYEMSNPSLAVWTETGVFTVRISTIYQGQAYVAEHQIEILEAGETGINPVGLSAISLSPNPASDKVTIEGFNGIATVSIMDLGGREMTRTTADGTLSVDVSGYPKGIYYVRVLSEETAYVGRLIVR